MFFLDARRGAASRGFARRSSEDAALQVPTFVEDPAVSTIAPGANAWSHDAARDAYLAALDGNWPAAAAE